MAIWQAETGDVQRATFTRRFFGDLWLEGLLMLVTLYIGWFIWLFFTAKTSQTPAKRLLNVYILDKESGRAVSAGRVWGRDVLVKGLLFGILSEITFGIAYAVDIGWALFDQDRQALHDKIVGTVVVYAPHGLPSTVGSSVARASGLPSPDPVASVRQTVDDVKQVGEDLRELARLRDEGILSEDEYEAKRKNLADTL